MDPLKFYRFANLKAMGIVSNRQQLSRLQKNHEFPAGRLLSPNDRVWAPQEIDAWLAKQLSEESQADLVERRSMTESKRASTRAAKKAGAPEQSSAA